MHDSSPRSGRSFRVHFIAMHGPENDLTVRVLFVECTRAQIIFEGFGAWPQCESWVNQFSGWSIDRDVLTFVQRRLKQKKMATIERVMVSVVDIEAIGLRRANR
jgi:hypothetical protein